MPDMPVADAIASICMSIASKIGPSVSERSNSRSSTQSACPAKSDHADPGARILAHVPDRLAEELERQRHVRLVHVVDLRDDRRVRHPVRRAGHHQGGHAVVQRRPDLLRQPRFCHGANPGAGARSRRLHEHLLDADLDSEARRRNRRGHQIGHVLVVVERTQAPGESLAHGTSDFNRRRAAPADGSDIGP